MEEIKALPVGQIVAIRSALFALAVKDAQILSYDEEAGVITAAMKRGLKKEKVEISVASQEGTSLLKINAPEKIVRELLPSFSRYIVEGARAIQEDAHHQWLNLIREEESRRNREEKIASLKDRVRSITDSIPLLRGKRASLPFPESEQEHQLEGQALDVSLDSESHDEDSSPSHHLKILHPESEVIAPITRETLPLAVPSSPGILVGDRYGRTFEIPIDPVINCDRATYLAICTFCFTVNFRDSNYCFHCGKPLKLEMAKEEVKRRIIKDANASLSFATFGFFVWFLLLALGVGPMMVALLRGGVSALLQELSKIVSALRDLGAFVILLALPVVLFWSVPTVWLGLQALRRGENALRDLGLSFYTNRTGRIRARLGQMLGLFEMFVGIGTTLFVLIIIMLVLLLK